MSSPITLGKWVILPQINCPYSQLASEIMNNLLHLSLSHQSSFVFFSFRGVRDPFSTQLGAILYLLLFKKKRKKQHKFFLIPGGLIFLLTFNYKLILMIKDADKMD